MVQVEDWIAGADVGVVSRIATDGEVSAGMNAGNGLEEAVKASDVGAAGDESRHVRRLRLIAPDEGEVARQAARVVAKAAVAADGRVGERA